MVLPLVAIGLALLSKSQQDQEQRAAYLHQIGRDEADAMAAIDARRAARAGDSGYMQAAMAHANNFPLPPRSNAGGMIAQVGGALLSQRDAPQPTESASNTAALEARDEARAAQGTPLRSGYFNDLDDALTSYDRYRGWG